MKKKEKSNFVRDEDDESLGSEAHSPFPVAPSSSSLSSSVSSSSRGSDARSRSRKKVKDAKPKRKQMRRRRNSHEAKEGGREETKQEHDTSSSRGSGSSDGVETRRRARSKKETRRLNASRSPSLLEAATSGSDSAQAPRRPKMRTRHKPRCPTRVATATSVTDHATKEKLDPHIETLCRVFRKYEVDGDGAINFVDLRDALNNTQTQQRLTDVEIQKRITEKDHSGQGVVGFDDFCAAFGPNPASNQRIAAAATNAVVKPQSNPPQLRKRQSTKPKATMSTRSQAHEANVGSPRAPTRVGQGHRLGYTQEPTSTRAPPAAADATQR
ncbi:Calmodulin-like myosin-light chain, partial [Globisporangium splendens]